MKLNATAVTTSSALAFATAVLLMLSSGFPLRADTFQVTGSVGPCPFSCVVSSSETWQILPILGDFSFEFDVAQAGEASFSYVGGPDFSASFTEVLRSSKLFTIQETQPDPLPGYPGSFPFPGFSAGRTEAVYWYPAGTVGHNGDSELELQVWMAPTWRADLQLFFAPGFTGIGSIDPGFRGSALRIWDAGCCSEAYYNITGASVASSVPEPATGLLLLFPTLCLLATLLWGRWSPFATCHLTWNTRLARSFWLHHQKLTDCRL